MRRGSRADEVRARARSPWGASAALLCSLACASPEEERGASPALAEASSSIYPEQAEAPTSTVAEVGVVSPEASPELRFAHAVITRSLEADLIDAVPRAQAASLAQVVKRVLVWWVDPRRDLRRGDELDVVWSVEGDDEPRAWAIWFRSQVLRGERRAVLHQAPDDEFPRWVDETGREVPLRLERSPVERYEQITSLVDDGRRHRGVDFKAPEGTPVVSPFSGTVTRTNWATRSNGRCVEILYDRTGQKATFLHLSRIAPGIRKGARVAAAQQIGAVGNTGRSFAPHLHYQLEKDGRVLDPFRVQKTWRAQLDESERRSASARLLIMEGMRMERP